MVLRNLNVRAFGVLENQEVKGLSPAINLFIGRNESGKTTLMRFIEFILFGFPRRFGGNRYDPPGSEHQSGSLEVLLREGSLVSIQRNLNECRIRDAAGIVQVAEPSALYFRGIDRDAFERIYCVELEELKRGDLLDPARTASWLFSAGAGLGGVSLADVLKGLDAEIAKITAPRSRTAELDRVIQGIKDNQRQIRELRSEEGHYTQLVARRQQLRAEVQKLEDDMARAGVRQKDLETLSRAREPVLALQRAEKWLAETEDVADFPRDGYETAKRLRAEIVDLETELSDASANAKARSIEIESLEVSESVLEQEPEINALAREREKYAEACSSLIDLERTLEEERRSLDRGLAELGPEWHSDTVGRVDISMPFRSNMRVLAEKLAQSESAISGPRHRLQAAGERQEEVRREIERVRSEGETQAGEGATLDQVFEKRDQLDELQRERMEVQTLRESLRAKEQLAHSRTGGWTTPQGWLSLVLGALLLGVALVTWVDLPAVARTGTLLVAAALAGIGVWALVAGRRESADPASTADQTEEASRLREEVKSRESRIDQLRESLGLSSPLSSVEVERLQRVLREQEEAAKKRNEHVARLAALGRDLDSATERSAVAEKELEESERLRDEVRAEWNDALASAKFPPCAPELFEGFLNRVDLARRAIEGIAAAERKLSANRDYISNIQQTIALAANKAGIRVDSRAPSGIDTLVQALEGARRQDAERAQLVASLNELTSQVTGLTERVNSRKESLAKLFARAGCADAQEFDLAFGKFAKRCEALDLAQQAKNTLLALVGGEAAVQRVRTGVEGLDEVSLNTELRELSERIEAYKTSFRNAYEEQSLITRSIDQLAHDTRLSAALQQKKTLEAEKGQWAMRWSELVLCRELIRTAKSKYEQERQPKLLQIASEVIADVTEGRYGVVGKMEGGIELEDRTTTGSKGHEIWSSGLADQVYLALRLAEAQSESAQEPLPVLLDDVLVRSDPDRQVGIARALVRFAQAGQVLLFTCQPSMLNVIQKAVLELNASELPLSVFEVQNGQVAQAVPKAG
ncbi:MAG: AAA family ATPase [Fimbriimonadaceae bacterium]|nr:AAA family ATPase [Fimbriimonadaceae bacterium]